MFSNKSSPNSILLSLIRYAKPGRDRPTCLRLLRILIIALQYMRYPFIFNSLDRLFRSYKSFAYYMLLTENSQKKIDLVKTYYQRSKIDCIRTYGFFQSIRIHDPETEILLASAAAKAMLSMQGTLRAFELLDFYISNIKQYAEILNNLKLHSAFLRLYLQACRQPGKRDNYIKTCGDLGRLSPGNDIRSSYYLAIDASSHDNKEYLAHMQKATSAGTGIRERAYSLLIDANVHCGNFKEACDIFTLARSDQPTYTETLLSGVVIENSRSCHKKGFLLFREYFETLGLAFPDSQITDSFDHCLRSIKFDLPEVRIPGNPKVSVIMPCYNGETFLDTSISSALGQTYKNLELIIVDDNSTDHSVEKMRQWASMDPRVRLMEKGINEGTYVSKNRAILKATGDFITFLDCDDWMHPEHIERHLNCTTKNIIMSYSDWIRVTEDFVPAVRQTGVFAHRNYSSMFIRKDVFFKAGYFDSVRSDADTEFLCRLDQIYDYRQIRKIDLPLSIGRLHNNSLTTSGPTAFDRAAISPMRLNYSNSWLDWHLHTLNSRLLKVPFPHSPRKFPAPDDILAPDVTT